MFKIRRSRDHDLIFNMGIPILVILHLYIVTDPRALIHHDEDNKVMRPSYLYNENSYRVKQVASLNQKQPSLRTS